MILDHGHYVIALGGMGGDYSAMPNGAAGGAYSQPLIRNTTAGSRAGGETRPRNVALLACMKL